MDGQRGLTHKSVHKFIKGLQLNEWESLYFENLVFFNQAKEKEEKDFYYKNMELARSHQTQAFLSKDQYDVLSDWLPLAIKELAHLQDFVLDSKWISQRFDHKATKEDVKEALKTLERLQLVSIDHEQNTIMSTDQNLQTPEVDASGPIAQYHKKILDLAKTAIDQQNVDHRCMNALIVAVEKRDLPAAFAKIGKFVREMNALFSQGKKNYDAVYELSIQLFRLDIDV